MKISQRGIDLIKRFEEFRSEPYICPAGIWTIGYGHTGGVDRWTVPICEQTAHDLMIKDLESVQVTICELVEVAINQNQFDSLCSFVFNLGRNNFKRSTLLKKLNAGDYEGTADEFLRWNKAKNQDGQLVVFPGLDARRRAERDLFLNSRLGSKVNKFLQTQ